jgi:threonine/homoserine/homoserine lactone efflux protein
MMTALVSGVRLGLFCGLAPGPLLALVLAQTLRPGPCEGCKIAIEPLVTDTPAIVLALLLASKMAQLRSLLGIVSIAGGSILDHQPQSIQPLPSYAGFWSQNSKVRVRCSTIQA